MTNQLQRDLRAAFERISAEPSPPARQLTERARRRAARGRATQLAATAAAVVAVVAGGIVTVRAAATPTAPTPSATGSGPAASTGAPVPGQRVIAAFSTPGRVDAHDRPLAPYSLVRDPSTGQLRPTPYDIVTPSPDGRRAIVVLEYPQLRIGVLDLPAGLPRWIEGGYQGTASWSPDGRRILITGGPQSGLSQQDKTLPRNNGFAIVDAASLRVAFTPVADVPNTLGANGVWLPDGQHIAISVGENGSPTGIRVHDLAGRVVRTLPAPGVLRSQAAVSPDGAHFALVDSPNADPYTGQLTIVDARTGALVSRSTALRGAGLVGWYDNSHLVVHGYGERGAANDFLAVIDLAGHQVRRVTLPRGPGGSGWTIIALGTGTGGGF